MHKIKKFQNPSSGLPWNLPGTSTELDLNKYLQNFTKNLNVQNISSVAKKGKSFMNILGGMSSTSGSINSAIPDNSNAPLTSGINMAYDAASDVVSFIPGIGPVIGGAMKASSLLTKGVGAVFGKLDGKTTQDQILSSSLFGATPLGIMNTAFGKKSKGYDSDLAKQVNIGYTADIGQESAKYGMFSNKARKAANRHNKNVDISNLLKSNAIYKAQQENLAVSNSWGDIADANQQRLLGGLDTRVLSVKKGGNINPALLRNIAKKVKGNSKKEDVKKFENGGKMNVIPDGALHARLNHLDGELGEAVTGKGIPVVTFDEGGEITQHAEIEVNEIIFNKDTTDKLERYFKLYNKADSDQEKNRIATECGKFLTGEVLENTDDRTGLLETVE